MIKALSGLGECGCCGPSYDGKERFQFCHARWSGHLIPKYPEWRYLKKIFTWTFTLYKKHKDGSTGVITTLETWNWVNQRTDTCNKWSGAWTEGTPTLLSGALPPGTWSPVLSPPNGYSELEAAIPRSDTMTFIPPENPANPLPDFWTIRTAPFNADIASFFYYKYGYWCYNNDAILNLWYPWPSESMIQWGKDYFVQHVSIKVEYSDLSADKYQFTDYMTAWNTIYSEMSLDEIKALAYDDPNYHFSAFFYGDSGEIIERRYYEAPTRFGVTCDWHDHWEDNGDGWFHDVGLVDSLGDVFPQAGDGYYETWVDGVQTPGLTDCQMPRQWVGSTGGVNGQWAAPDGDIITLPHSTYIVCGSYVAPTPDGTRAGVDGIPDIGSVFWGDQFANGAAKSWPDQSNSFARITLVPLATGVSKHALNRYAFPTPYTENVVNPVGGCASLPNTGDKLIGVQSTAYAFEFIRSGDCP